MPQHTSSEGPQPDPADGSSDLRQRKRIRTKQMVQKEALRLFADKGYEQTTVDDIAHAAAMSPRTFFRYFPTKEDVALWDEYDELPVHDLLRIRPGDDALTQLILRVRDMFEELYRKDPDLLLARTKLSFTVPEVRARFFDQQLTMLGPYVARIADFINVPRDDLHLPVTLAAFYSALFVAMERWQRNDGRDDLMRQLDDAIAALAAGAAGLRDTIQAADAPGGHSSRKTAAPAKRKTK
jgi:AcrR family transcriptional regulator